MEKAEVPAGRIYTAADIAADPHYAARGMIQEVVAGDGEPLKVPGRHSEALGDARRDPQRRRRGSASTPTKSCAASIFPPRRLQRCAKRKII